MSLSKPVQTIDESKIITVSEISPSLKCVFCKNILQNAMQSACGCRYCEKCVIRYLNDADPKECFNKTDECVLVSLKEQSDYLVRIDHAARRELSKRKVKCLNADNGCKDTPEFKNLSNHLVDCAFGYKPCSLCGQNITKSNEAWHVEHECNQRLVACDLCGKDNIRLQDLDSRHKNLKFYDDRDVCCEKFESSCPYCGGGNFNRDTIQSHHEMCEDWKKKCMFSKFGCNFENEQNYAMDNHYDTKMADHLKMISETIRSQEIAIIKLEKDSSDAFQQMEKLKGHQKILQDLATQAQVKTAEILENLSGSSAPITNHRNESEYIPRNGCLVWKITNYREKCESSTSYYSSDPFYTSSFGYKLCARIYLNGDGAGQGSHVSLFIVIMPGEYDDILIWPFKHKVTISILDQHGRNNPYSHTFPPDPNSRCYAKPSKNANNVASGVPCFIRKSLLDPDSGSRFINNNCLFVQVDVDVSS